MDPTDIGLFHLAERRLTWVDRRQRLLAQNVANANTPGWIPRDLAPFETGLSSWKLARTAPRHLEPSGHSAGEAVIRPTAKSPNGNAISIEAQLAQIADTAGIQELSINLHRRYASMMRTAFGRPG